MRNGRDVHQAVSKRDLALRPVDPDTVPRGVAALLEDSAAPADRFLRLVAHSTPALEAAAAQLRAAARMRLSPGLRHAIALRK